ncbi:MAG TPA: protein-export chaperone SecB [Bacteroidales bacterium]|jgi:preprotein translocase subunit SecB|nr:protein-export chaperone SecB [Bacteroidales bacterium]
MENKSVFQFKSYKVILSHLEIKEFSNKIGQDINIEMGVSHKKDNKNIFITLETTIKDNVENLFINVKLVGLFNCENCDEIEENNFININGPAILFPYMRAHISSLTSMANIPTLVLPTINFVARGSNK